MVTKSKASAPAAETSLRNQRAEQSRSAPDRVRPADVSSNLSPQGINFNGNGYYDEAEFVAEMTKGRNVVVVSRGRKGQRWSVQLREFWKTPAGDWAPTKMGAISLPYEDGEEWVKAFTDAFQIV
jgi:hypothetical protein